MNDSVQRYFEQQKELGFKTVFLPDESSPPPLVKTATAASIPKVLPPSKNSLLFINDATNETLAQKADELLYKMIENGMGLKKESVYFIHLTPNTLADGARLIHEQIEKVNPAYLCCLGKKAADLFLALPDAPELSSLRQRFYPFGAAKVLVTFSPASLLQNESWKKDAWEDLKFLMRDMGLAIPGKQQ